MKVVHIVGFYPEIGGPFTLAKHLIETLNNKGIDSIVLSPIPINYDKRKLELLYSEKYKIKFVEESIFAKYIPSFSIKWRKAISDNSKHIDLIHIHGFFDYFTFIATSYNNKIPIILSPLGSLILSDMYKRKMVKKYLYYYLIGKHIINNIDSLHVLSDFEKENAQKVISKFYNINYMKYFLLPAGINLKEFKILPKNGEYKNKNNLLKNNNYLLFLGRVDAIKGIDILIKAFKLLSSDYNNLYLVIAGPETNNYGNTLKILVENYGIAKKVIFAGMIPEKDKKSIIIDSEMFILPSYYDCFPITVLEAMACNVPIVISNKVGICKEVENNKAGLISENNPNSLYKCIKILLDNKDFRKEIANNGNNLVNKKYNIEYVTDGLIEEYKNIIKNKNS